MDSVFTQEMDLTAQAEKFSELFEQDSRRYSRALTEEQEAQGR